MYPQTTEELREVTIKSHSQLNSRQGPEVRKHITGSHWTNILGTHTLRPEIHVGIWARMLQPGQARKLRPEDAHITTLDPYCDLGTHATSSACTHYALRPMLHPGQARTYVLGTRTLRPGSHVASPGTHAKWSLRVLSWGSMLRFLSASGAVGKPLEK